MMYKNWTCNVPLIYIRDRGSDDEWHLVGSDPHDSLEVIDDEKFLMYENMQNCDTSEEGYEFFGVSFEADAEDVMYDLRKWEEEPHYGNGKS